MFVLLECRVLAGSGRKEGLRVERKAGPEIRGSWVILREMGSHVWT